MVVVIVCLSMNNSCDIMPAGIYERTEEHKKKYEKFKEDNNMLLIEEKDYKQLASSYSQFIENWESA